MLITLLIAALSAAGGYTTMETKDHGAVSAALAAGGPEAPGDSRSPAEIRRDGNQLKGSRSLYLQQHAHNPLDWYPWSDEALARSVDLDRPIFLSIGYASCHWCHVMEREVFESDEVARYMNEHFINIKVDREERPDIDAVYMDAVQAMTGSGGWPMSVFLTPRGEPFFGGTYFPRDQFMALARRIVQLRTQDRAMLDTQAAKLAKALQAEHTPTEGEPPDAEVWSDAAARAGAAFDDTWGGTRGRMKFPTPLRWMALLHYHRRTGDARSGEMVRKTLDQMASGGIRDHVGGGFHRYTVETTWLVPHFEKMLYDNALLASLYIQGSVAFDEPRYAAVARDTLDFLLREMTDDAGGVYASFDADSGGEEGSFYVWTPEELAAVAGPEDGPPLAALLGVTPTGNFEGHSIPTRRVAAARVAERHGLPVERAEGLFDRWRDALRAHRAGRVWPSLDRKVITAWNGMALSALAQGYRVLGDERYRTAAERCAEFLWTTHRTGADGASDEARLLRVSNGGVAEHDAVLDDYALHGLGLLDLYEATGATVHLSRALTLADEAVARFRRPDSGYYMTAAGADVPIARKTELFDHARPSGNSAMLRLELRVAALTGDHARWERVRGDVGARADLMRRAGLEMAWWFDVALTLSGDYWEVVVAGDDDDPTTAALLGEVHPSLPPNAALLRVPAAGASAALAKLVPPTEGKRARAGRATAYVCRLGACKRPTSDPAELRRQLSSQ